MLFRSLLAERHPHITQWLQSRGMAEGARQAFLEQFSADSQGVGFAVLGGAFGEGIDLPGARLIGAFIATLGLMVAARGFAKWFTGGMPVSMLTDDFAWLGEGGNPVVIFLVIAVIFHIVLRYTRFGKYTYAIGANRQDATFLGFLPVYTTTNLQITLTVGSSTDCTTAIMFDASQMVILERSGIEIAVSRDIAFNTDQTAVRAIGRTAVATLQPLSVELITGIRP